MTQTAYIPQKFAKVGMVLKIRWHGEWENGWEVLNKYGTMVKPPDPRKAVREHKNNTGDSLPK